MGEHRMPRGKQRVTDHTELSGLLLNEFTFSHFGDLGA
jgi:hypothetical protein